MIATRITITLAENGLINLEGPPLMQNRDTYDYVCNEIQRMIMEEYNRVMATASSPIHLLGN